MSKENDQQQTSKARIWEGKIIKIVGKTSGEEGKDME